MPRVPHPLWNTAATVIAARLGADFVLLQNFGPVWTGNTRPVVTVHDAIYDRRPQDFTKHERRYLRLIRPLLRRASAVVTVSDTEAKNLRAQGLVPPSTPIWAIHNGVRKAILGSPSFSSSHQPSFLVLGRLTSRKRPSLAIRALAEPEAPSGATLHFVGPDGGELDSSIRLGEELGVSDRVHFHGKKSDEELRHIASGCSALLFLSHDEGFGLPILEGMASGLPVIASDIAIHHEVAGTAAMLVESDAAAVARAMSDVLTQPTRASMIQQGQIRAAEFTWEAAAQKLLQSMRNYDDQTR